MDPDDTYADMVAQARAILQDNDRGLTSETDACVALAELVVNLDDWIQKGGFLPRKFR